ncbi:YkgJ family cysteine cluster protein [Oceanispirochaeta sp.]|jgi:Fe-S-cluster containining protein|uniref:YkgJ family cysteine cluster protein n=1 Tax=Oceanispirochaeta sp. TaxID=2035350 RepID=UPI0026101AB0|nr:YkgJ family cysteine cluster protein [Oceanispirochaeta sp.]MDA3957693.1 YkgJ family cysteine cluster protein [Oceanispirochaeta sp.]
MGRVTDSCEYKSILDRASQKYKENQDYFKKLKKVKSGVVDPPMRHLHFEVFKEIDCLKCSNCCRGTGPLLRERDINRLSRSLKMRPGSFTETYLKVDEEADYIFKNMPCPFIQNDNLCMVYQERPDACRNFPHTDGMSFKKYSSQMLENTRICPAVYLRFERMKKEIPL